jgi:hypothetical protein
MSQIEPQASDPLLKLHKMSRTAGLGTTEYVAVNPLAVTAAVFGLASAMVTFDAIFLLVPAVAVVLGLVALRQIRRSAGTQTGKALAWGGIVLAALFAAFVGSRHVMAMLASRDDEAQINRALADFGADIAARNYDAAYARFSSELAGRVTKQNLADQFNIRHDSPAYGNIVAMKGNGVVKFEETDVPGARPTAWTYGILTLKLGAETREDREAMFFIKTDGKWLIDDIPGIFPKPQKLPSPGTRVPNSKIG